MFNYAHVATFWRPERVLGGLHRSDADSYTTLFAGNFQFDSTPSS